MDFILYKNILQGRNICDFVDEPAEPPVMVQQALSWLLHHPDTIVGQEY